MSGLEAIGIAASIIQVADLGTKLSVQLFSLYRRVKSANESIQLLSNEIALVSAILRELGDNLKEEESSKLCSDEAFRTLGLVLNQCRDVLGQIQRVVDDNDRPGKSRFQQVTGKFRIVLLEPSLNQLKVNLERLKSTMLLLLNVITYAGQIRSNNVPTLVQEQRDLIQSLLEDKHIDNQKPRQSDVAAESSRASNKTIHGKLAHARAYELSDEKHDSKDHPSTLKNQPSQGSTECANSSEARIEANTASEGNEPTELKEYNILIQSMLNEIESCKSKLENNRQSRIKNGVLNIHYGEIMRFQIEYGRSIPIDHSFATEKKPENTIEPKVKSPSLPLTGSHKSTQSTTMSVDCYIGSDESDVSETDMFIPSIKGRTSLCRRLERKETKSNSNSIKPHQVQQRMHEESDGEAVRYSRRRATGRVYREAIPRHHDYESAINQRVLERSGFRYDIENWNHQQEIEVGEHEQDIERLERKNAKTYWKNPPLHEGTPDEPQRVQQKVYDESDKEGVRLSRRRATSRVSREAFPHHRDHEFGMNQRMLERNDICQDMELSRHLEDIERLERELAKFRRKSSPPREVAPAAPQPVPHEFSLICDDEECHNASEQFQAYAAKELEVTGGEQGDSASTAGNSNDEERESENGPQERQSTLSISPQESMMLGMRGDDAQKPTFSEGLSLPDNLEDLLAQWTTLDKQELQCGHVSAF